MSARTMAETYTQRVLGRKSDTSDAVQRARLAVLVARFQAAVDELESAKKIADRIEGDAESRTDYWQAAVDSSFICEESMRSMINQIAWIQEFCK